MVKDPVCGMEIPASGETFTVDGGNVGRPGTTFYFCAPMCRTTFLGDPEKFLAGTRNSMEAIEKRVMLYWFILLLGFGVSLVLVFLLLPGR
ncbi:MAG: YHS domain-containing protein [Halobacteria archaeon]